MEKRIALRGKRGRVRRVPAKKVNSLERKKGRVKAKETLFAPKEGASGE